MPWGTPGESTVRLGKAGGLGVTDIQWGTPRLATVGKERFDAPSADGSGDFEGPGGCVWYATDESRARGHDS